MTESTNCYRCYGSGKVTETRTEQDTTMSAAIGAGLGIGYLPMWKTVTERVNCPSCYGSGKRR